MFLCKECLKDYLVGTVRGYEPLKESTLVGMPLSYGPCEDCHEMKYCYDIHHISLAHKDSEYARRNVAFRTVTVEGIDRALQRGHKRVTYTRDEHNIFTVEGEGGELLTYYQRKWSDNYHFVSFDNTQPGSLVRMYGTFREESDAAVFFYDILRKLCG